MLTKTLSEAKKKQRNILIKAMNNDIGSIDSSKDSWNPAQISERAKDISYIRSLVDSWNPAQLNEALRMLDLQVIDTWNPAQIEEQRRNLVFYLAERTLTGNPITLKILGKLTPEVTGLKVTMNPIQSGTGDPSPTNIRPITGRTDVSVIRTAGEDVETKTHQYSETIYGGFDDFVNGKLDVTHNYIKGTSSNIVRNSGTSWYIQKPSDIKVTGAEQRGVLVSNVFANADIFIHPLGVIRFNTKLEYASVADLLTAIPDIEFVYPKQTPTTISTSAEEITLLKGTNVLSTDGDSIELKYKQNF